MKKVYKVIHKKSNVLIDGNPKLPAAASLEYGEIAINYAVSGETLSIKNVSDDIVTFSSDNKLLGKVSQDFVTTADTADFLTGVAVNGTAVAVTNQVAQVNVQGLPAVTASDNGKILRVVNGEWAIVTPTIVYGGSGTPPASLGNDGDVYLQS